MYENDLFVHIHGNLGCLQHYIYIISRLDKRGNFLHYETLLKKKKKKKMKPTSFILLGQLIANYFACLEMARF